MPRNEIDDLLKKVVPLDDARADQDVMVLEGLKSGSAVVAREDKGRSSYGCINGTATWGISALHWQDSGKKTWRKAWLI